MSAHDDPGSITILIKGLRAADPVAADRIWRRYFDKLLPLARAKLGALPAQNIDEEDVLVSVFDRLFRAAQAGRFAKLNDRHDLWEVLLLLTEHKVADVFRRANAKKRGSGKVVTERDLGNNDHSHQVTLDQLASCQPTAEFVAMFNEQVARAFEALSERVREVAMMKLEGFTNVEIQHKLDLSLSAVERKLRLIRDTWREEFDQDGKL